MPIRRWQAGDNEDWNKASNWLPPVVPAKGDEVVSFLEEVDYEEKAEPGHQGV
jgi:hypothetical protein